MKEIWLVGREMGGWAEAGGIKDVVRDQASAFPRIGWKTFVILPLYGFLRGRVEDKGQLVWSGPSAHPQFKGALEAWKVEEETFTLFFLASPGFADKNSLYTYTAVDEARNPGHVRGEGFSDGFALNLEFQWAVATFWFSQTIHPAYVLGHDGHCGFLPAICRTHPDFRGAFRSTTFGLVIHNAGPGYRQEMEATPYVEALIGLPPAEVRGALLDHRYDPMVSASRHGKLATVSQNYADELLTGRNDRWSGPFGRWLRTTKTPLRGITNGISTDDKDPRDPVAAGLAAGFDPLRGDWEGKDRCRRSLRETLLLKPTETYGRLVRWEGPLYVMQGRLTAQKGVEALLDLVSRALREGLPVSFLIMAQGERRFEERFIHLARDSVHLGRFLFVNKFEDSLARLVFASGDFFLMPSEYEPCGLTDLKAQLMGTLPIVHRVGGLVKVIDDRTGFSYSKNQGGGFWGAFLRSYRLWGESPAKIVEMRRNAFMSVLEDYQWPRILEDHYVPWLTESVRFPILTASSPT